MKPKKSIFRWYDALLLRVIPPLVALLVKLLMQTCRITKVEGQEREKEALIRSGGRAVYATWHQRMAYHARYFGSRHITILISQSRDGEYGARIAARLGFRSVRGSSTRGGIGALREMIERIKRGELAGVFADGPLGPPRIAKMGAIIMARSADAPLIPVLWGADRCWCLNTWDRYLIPKPFARVAVYFAEPIWIPASTKREGLEQFRTLLEGRLNEGARWCDEQFGQQRPWRKVKKQGVSELGPIHDSPGQQK